MTQIKEESGSTYCGLLHILSKSHAVTPEPRLMRCLPDVAIESNMITERQKCYCLPDFACLDDKQVGLRFLEKASGDTALHCR
uniref:Uncharacterized protein n=1 Tax=Steinernema glaseri TaxID=37863 RepID=A0A1I7YN07_9BILA